MSYGNKTILSFTDAKGKRHEIIKTPGGKAFLKQTTMIELSVQELEDLMFAVGKGIGE